MSTGTAHLNGVWGLGADDVYVVGDGRTILRNSTGTWTTELDGGNVSFYQIWGTDADNLYAVGIPNTGLPDSEPIVHFNGSDWQPMVTPSDRYWYLDIFGFADSSFVVVGEIPPGGPAGPGLHGQGLIYRWTGQTWKKGSSAFILDLWAVTGNAPDDMLAVGFGGTVFEFAGDAWSEVETETGSWLTDVSAASDNRFFAVGKGGTLLRYDR
jgi:hypothetical protein